MILYLKNWWLRIFSYCACFYSFSDLVSSSYNLNCYLMSLFPLAGRQEGILSLLSWKENRKLTDNEFTVILKFYCELKNIDLKFSILELNLSDNPAVILFSYRIIMSCSRKLKSSSILCSLHYSLQPFYNPITPRLPPLVFLMLLYDHTT